jgi:transcriptional regulator with XRE-family HTH domain
MARGNPRLRTDDGRINGISTRVRERRELIQLTQDALCARLAVATNGAWNPDRMEIYRIESGSRTVTDLELRALAAALECAPAWLLLGDVLDAK